MNQNKNERLELFKELEQEAKKNLVKKDSFEFALKQLEMLNEIQKVIVERKRVMIEHLKRFKSVEGER